MSSTVWCLTNKTVTDTVPLVDPLQDTSLVSITDAAMVMWPCRQWKTSFVPRKPRHTFYNYRSRVILYVGYHLNWSGRIRWSENDQWILSKCICKKVKLLSLSYTYYHKIIHRIRVLAWFKASVKGGYSLGHCYVELDNIYWPYRLLNTEPWYLMFGFQKLRMSQKNGFKMGLQKPAGNMSIFYMQWHAPGFVKLHKIMFWPLLLWLVCCKSLNILQLL